MAINILLEINKQIQEHIETGEELVEVEMIQWIHEELARAIPKIEELKEKAWMYDDLNR